MQNCLELFNLFQTNTTVKGPIIREGANKCVMEYDIWFARERHHVKRCSWATVLVRIRSFLFKRIGLSKNRPRLHRAIRKMISWRFPLLFARKTSRLVFQILKLVWEESSLLSLARIICWTKTYCRTIYMKAMRNVHWSVKRFRSFALAEYRHDRVIRNELHIKFCGRIFSRLRWCCCSGHRFTMTAILVGVCQKHQSR